MNHNTRWERIGKWCLYALIFLAPILFLPWTADPVGVNKQAVVVALTALGLIFLLVNTLSEGKILMPKSLIVWAVIAFALVLGFSAYVSDSRATSFYGLFGRVDAFPNVLTFGLVFLLAALLLRSGKDVVKGIWAMLISTGLLAVFQTVHFLAGSLLDKFLLPWDFTRFIDFNPVGTVNALAMLFAFSLTASVAMLAGKQFSRAVKAALYAACVLFLLNVIVIGFWPAWFGLTLAMIVLVSYRFVKELHAIKAQGLSSEHFSLKKLSLPLAVFVISFLLLLAKPPIGNFLNFSLEVKPTYGATLEIAKQTLGQGWLRTLAGSGPGTFVNDYLLYRSASLNATSLWPLTFQQGSAFWPTILATAGYLGAASFAALLLVFLLVAFRAVARNLKETPVTVPGEERQNLEIGLIVGALGAFLLLLLLFLYPLNYVLGIALFFSLGIFVSSAAGLKEGGRREISLLASPQRALILSLAAILLITLTAYGLYTAGKLYVAEVYYGKALSLSADPKKLDEAALHFGRAVNLNPNKSNYLRALSQTFLAQISNLVNQPQDEKLTQAQVQNQLQTAISNAIASAQGALRLDQTDFSNWWNLGSVYENVILFADGADKQAVAAYEEAFKRNPQSPSIQLDIARTYLAAADRADLNAAALARQEKKEPEKENALKKEKEDNINLGKAALEKSISLKEDYVPAHYLFSQAYERTGDIAKAIEKAHDTRKFVPNDLDALFQLGRLYFRDNQLEKAQEQFEPAVAANPNYSNGRYFLGLIYDKQGFKAKAQEQFEKIVELNPENKEVAQILQNLKSGNPALLNIGQPTPPSPPTPPAATEGESMKKP